MSEWRAPTRLPNIRDERQVSLDIETYDPHLSDKGPSHVFDEGYIVGVAVAVTPEDKWFIPILNPYHDGFDKREVVEWLDSLSGGPVIVGANLMYDLSWLYSYGAKGLLQNSRWDVQFAEALLDEHRDSYTLDDIAKTYGFHGKDTEAMYKYGAEKFGGRPTARQQGKNIYRMPLHILGPYAEMDAVLPLLIKEKQEPLIEQQGLGTVLDIEHRLMPMLMFMHMNGVLVDLDKRSEVQAHLDDQYKKTLDRFYELVGKEVNINSSRELQQLFDSFGWEYPKTAKGNPSFTKEFLASHDSEAARLILDLRKIDKMKTTFIDGYFSLSYKGRIHPMYHPLRTSENGTVSGRIASSRPNIQNIPSRDKVYGPLIRSLFVPAEGNVWCKLDYSQIEYRFLTHYAIGKGSEDARRKYIMDPRTDFHSMVEKETGMDRKSAKCLNFGLCYGQGILKTAESLGVDIDEAIEYRELFFSRSPYIKQTFDLAAHRAQTRGYIRTILGRRARFPFWEPADFELSRKLERPMKSRSECAVWTARQLGVEYPSSKLVKRARAYKALNALLQGSSADLLKKAMVDIWESGVCDVIGVPLVTVHDELDFSVPRTKEGAEAILEVKRLMENAISLKVPVIADIEIGSNWGEVEEVDSENVVGHVVR